jgi:predicted GH43/DUF377 family glycosyl hydrolase
MKKHGNNPLITPTMITPSHADLVVKGALNPGAIQFHDEVLLLLRIAESGKETSEEITVPVYRFDSQGGVLEMLHFEKNDPEVRRIDTRAIIHKGQEYISTLSHLRLARSTDGVHFSVDEKPFLTPQNTSEEFGVEDARVVQIDGCYYITYTAVSRDSYGTSLLRTKNFVDKEYVGMIFNAPNKDVCIFPEKIKGKYFALHRPYNHDFGKSSIWLAESPDLVHWGNHRCLIRPAKNKWESEKIGGGAPPVKTADGWLEIYHGKTRVGGKDFYSLMVLLLDLDDPSTVIFRGESPIIVPEKDYETNGFVPNVVFLNGMVLRTKEDLALYYSACDETTCLAECKIRDLIHA